MSHYNVFVTGFFRPAKIGQNRVEIYVQNLIRKEVSCYVALQFRAVIARNLKVGTKTGLVILFVTVCDVVSP